MKRVLEMAGGRDHVKTQGTDPWAEAAADVPGPRRWFNVLMIGGSDAEVTRMHRTLNHVQPLPWRSSEDVEREVAYLALSGSGRRVEDLRIEDILVACEEVESRHLIEDGAVGRHFRNLWQMSTAYCRQCLRGLLALRPGDIASSARAPAAGGLFREGFSLTRAALPPFRVLQGSYRYAGRQWCQKNWGTPEDARLVASRIESLGPGQSVAVYEFETVDGAPFGALQRLCRRNPRLKVACVAVDADTGRRQSLVSVAGGGASVAAMAPVRMANGGFSGPSYLETTQAVRRKLLAQMNLAAVA